MGIEKQLKEELDKATNIIKDLKFELQNRQFSPETKEIIKKLEKELKEKDAKVVELAESVAKTQAPPKRVKLNVEYSNKYTVNQIKAFKKNGISTENLATEPDLEDSEITA